MLITKEPAAVTVTLGMVNVFQIVRCTIECPTEDQVSVVLDVQGSLVEKDGTVSSVIPLPSVRLDADKADGLYALIRDLLYDSFQSSSVVVPTTAVLSQLVAAPIVSSADSLQAQPVDVQKG